MVALGPLSLMTLAVDVIILGALATGLFTPSSQRWRQTLGALTAVAAFNLLQSIASYGEIEGAFLTIDRLLHGAEVTSLAAVVFVFRREISRPLRILDRATSLRASHGLDMDSLGAPVLSLTRDGVIRQVNQAAIGIFDSDSGRMLGSEVFLLFQSGFARREARKSFLRFIGSAGAVDTEYEQRVKAPTGDRLIRWRRTAQLDESGAVIGVVTYGEDVTAQRAMQRRLKEESYLLDSVHDAVIVTGTENHLLYFNRAAHDMLGMDAEQFVQTPPTKWLTQESRAIVKRHLEMVMQGADQIVEVVAVTTDDRRIPVELRSQVIAFDGESAVMSVMRDVSSRTQARQLMEQMAYTDALTGLPNRRTVQERIARAIDIDHVAGKHSSVLYLDVDNLKRVNDNLGHAAGDRLITLVGQRLVALLRAEDMVARVGGDEFVIVLPDDGEPRSSEEVAQRLLDGLSDPLIVDGHELRLSASIGIAPCDSGMAPEDILVAADRAMYTAKRSGGRRYVSYSAQIDVAVLERFTLQNELARAVDAEELRLHFQPVVEANGHRVVAAEALVRWEHRQKGLLAPAHFIDLAESSGLIREIGMWVLSEACRSLAAWRGLGLELDWVAVNVSPMQLFEHDFVSALTDVLELHGLDPGDLELEITETQAMEYSDQIARVLGELSRLGVRIALDDFGVGHSSLERLRRLPITTLKLDRTFVADICDSSDQYHPIIDTVLVMGNNLGLTVIAEGVETSCQAEYLVAAGCQRLQGYAFARPVTSDAFVEMCGTPLEPSPCPNLPTCRRLEAS